MRSGIIFDIKQFAVFDGPGMRETIFLKGCPLRCPWCHNPEGQSIKPELMVSRAACTHCKRCISACSSLSFCTVCGKCIPECPLGLRHIAGEEISTKELERRIRKDVGIYLKCGGGITVSGGEPLFQPDFLLEFLRRIPDIHRAIETSGYAPESVYKEVYENVDFILQDLKIFDSADHEYHIGVSNSIILNNTRILIDGDKPFIIRIPLIHGVTDTEKNYREIASFLDGSKNLQRVELLPYVKAAAAKYGMINRRYEPKTFNPDEEPVINTDIFEERNIRCVVL